MVKRRNLIIAIVLILTVLALAIFYINNTKISGKIVNTSQNIVPGTTQPVVVTKENLASFLQNQEVVKNIPNGKIINLRFYNFNAGERQWEEGYSLTNKKVSNGLSENADLTIIVSSKYVSEMGSFCATMKKAKANGDIGYETKLSDAKLLWDYKSMLKYRDCIGM
jgi:type 1 fimbria pilin